MVDSIRKESPRVTEPRRKNGIPSFRWQLSDGDEISACPDCTFWHARVEIDPDEIHELSPTLYLREWHEADCPCWTADA